MVTAAQKGLLICGAVALAGGGLAGIGLGNYAQSGAFEFYKQTPPPIVQTAYAATADSAGTYPISRPAATLPYPENPYPPRLTIARPAEAADYQRAAQLDDQPAPAPVEDAAPPEDDAPVVTPQRGSWTAPEASEPAPAQSVGGGIY
jgi:hypothetical protein